MDQVSLDPNAAAQRFECATCGSQMTFDAASQQMRCTHCGSSGAVSPSAPDQRVVEHDLMAGLSRATEHGFGAVVKTTQCSECGARVAFQDRVTSTVCEFCGSSQVMEQEGNRNLIRPESLLPFAVDEPTAKSRYTGWMGGLWFRPSDLKSRARLGQVAGVYVPYWTFDARADSRWTAQAGYHYYVTETYKDSNGNQQTRQKQQTRWEHAQGGRTDLYDDVLICASRGLPVDIAESLKTFNTSRLVPYQPQYLAGWRAEEYALPLNDAWQNAAGKMNGTQRSRCSGDVPGDTQRNLDVLTQFSQQTFKHVLLPLWIASYRYNDKVYRFLVNGQTGEVKGQAPYSWVKITAFIFMILLLLASAYGAYALLSDGG